jgi:hypothetical protein
MSSRTTLWRRKKRVKEVWGGILTNETSEKRYFALFTNSYCIFLFSWILPTLSELFASAVLNQTRPSNTVENNALPTMPCLETFSSTEMEKSDVESNTTDERLWLEEKDDDCDAWMSVELESMFEHLGVDADPSNTFSCRSVTSICNCFVYRKIFQIK